MIAVYKRELHSIFHSVIGYVYMAVILFFIGLFYLSNNLVGGSSYFSATLSGLISILLLVTPILTMRIMTEDKKQNTDLLLYTSPVSISKILIGKYLSLLTTFLLPMAIISLYPLIMSIYGKVGFLEAYTSIIGFIAYGALCLAIGMFISSITENQIVAAIVTMIILYIGYIMNGITGLFFTSENLATKILNCYNFYNPLVTFFEGTFNLNNLVYFITVTVLFLFFTYQVVQKKRWSMSTKRLKRGAFSTGSILLGIILTVAINFGMNQIPGKYTSFDVTAQNVYGITDQTKELLSSLDEDIVFYVLVSESEQNSTVEKTLNQYMDLSEHITVSYRDPSLYPNFAAKYNTDELETNSIIVEGSKRFKTINYSNLYETEIDYNTYAETTTGYDAEGQLTSAIDYVTNDTLPKLYVLSGHDELDLPAELTALISKENIETEIINLLNYDSIPTDAAGIFISAPTTDYTKEDAEKVLSYLESGGHAIIVSSWSENDLSNFNSIAEAYGIELADGIVVESDSNRYYQNPYYLLPNIAGSEVTSSLCSDSRYVFMPYAQGVTVEEDLRDSLTIKQILTTSDSAYVKVNPSDMKTYEKEAGDIDGPFTLGVYATEDVGDNQMRLLYLTTENFITKSVDDTVAGGNYELMMNAVGKMVNHETSVSVPAKSYEMASLTLTKVQSLLWGIFVVLVLPLSLLASGLIIWAGRRKR